METTLCEVWAAKGCMFFAAHCRHHRPADISALWPAAGSVALTLLAGHCLEWLQPLVSAGPPEGPQDWSSTVTTRCNCTPSCAVCQSLVDFMADPAETFMQFHPGHPDDHYHIEQCARKHNRAVLQKGCMHVLDCALACLQSCRQMKAWRDVDSGFSCYGDDEEPAKMYIRKHRKQHKEQMATYIRRRTQLKELTALLAYIVPGLFSTHWMRHEEYAHKAFRPPIDANTGHAAVGLCEQARSRSCRQRNPA